jgi:hypothetical protein
MIKLGLGDVAIYRDTRCSRPTDETGCNQWAIVVDENGGLARRNSRVIRISFEELLTKPNLHFRENPYVEHRERIAAYFVKHANKHDHFEAGEKALLQGNLQPFEWGDLFPVKPEYPTVDEFERAWDNLLISARPMDTIFTARRNDISSKAIAWITKGPFSHVATYVGNDKIWESVTSGLRTGKLSDLYKSRENWVAAYRHVQHLDRVFLEKDADRIAREAADSYRIGYNWYQAARHGLLSFRGMHEEAKVPNSFLYRGSWVLIAHA